MLSGMRRLLPLLPLAIAAACAAPDFGDDEGIVVPPRPDATADDVAQIPPGDDGGAETAAPIAAGSHLFSMSFGGPENDYLSHGTVDPAGNLMLAGSFEASIDLGCGAITSAGSLDMLFAKLDPKGKCVFSQRFGDTSEQSGLNLVGSGAQDVFAVGIFKSTVTVSTTTLTAADPAFDILVLRLTPLGLYNAHYQLGGAGLQLATGLAADGTRGVFVNGYNAGTVSLPQATSTAGANDVLVAHLFSTQDWSKGFGDVGDQYGTDVAYDPAGSVVTVGYFGSTVDFGGGARASAGGLDAFVVKRALDGAHIWSLGLGDLGDQRADRVVVDSAGNIFIAGFFAATFNVAGGPPLSSKGASDFYVAKLDKDGKHVWSKSFGGAGADEVSALALAPDGSILVAGKSFGPLDLGGGVMPPLGDADAFLMKLDASGKHVWSKRFGDVGLDTANAVGATATGDVWVAGYFHGTIDFGGGQVESHGKADLFVARFAP
jgi:hypothetical protein